MKPSDWVARAMTLAQATGLTTVARWIVNRPGCLLTFHRVAAPGTWATLPNRNFYIDATFLAKLLDSLLAAGRAIVTMDEAANRIEAGDRRPFVNISIDDGYRDTAELAAPLFRARCVPLTVFVTTGIPDGTMPMWTAGLETVLLQRAQIHLEDGSAANTGTAEAKRALYHKLAAAWEADDPTLRYTRFCALNASDPDSLHQRNALSWPMLEAMRADPCIEIGAHTIRHARLSTLDAAAALHEIAGSRARLQQRLGLPVRHFAYPYGRAGDCGAREFGMARDAGFATAATTRRGLAGPADHARLHALPRNTLNGAHQRTAQAETHLSGLGGLLGHGPRLHSLLTG